MESMGRRKKGRRRGRRAREGGDYILVNSHTFWAKSIRLSHANGREC
jgi:hypothetical protein